MVGFLGKNPMTAYLTMMGVRLVELHRVLNPTGSLYLHCDPTASHYLKILLDAVFGAKNYKNEIIWKRTTTHSNSKTWSRVSDVIYFYAKSQNSFTWNTQREAHSKSYIASKYRHDDGNGRGQYRLDNMTSPNRHCPKYQAGAAKHGWRRVRQSQGVSETLCMRLSPCGFHGSSVEPFGV